MKPFGSSKKDSAGTPSTNTNSGFDRLNHQKIIRQWFMQPECFCKEIEKEQSKYPDMCLFHLSKTHLTEAYHVKKECDRQVAGQKTKIAPPSVSTSSGQLRNIKEELFEDAVTEDTPDVDFDPNDTNDAVLYYFERMTNHYLCLVKNTSSSSVTACHNMKYPMIADSRANFHMFKEQEFFTSLTPAQGQVVLGDGKTCLSFHGIGTVTCRVGDNILTIVDVCYVPDLEAGLGNI